MRGSTSVPAMPVQRVTSATMIKQIAAEPNLVHLDVRSEPEFAEGHAPGAYNIPFMHMGPAGMTANPAFLADVQRVFPDLATPLLLSCRSGGRSARAASVLEAAGYSQLADHIGGFGGGNGDAGWVASGGSVVTACLPGHSYAELKG